MTSALENRHFHLILNMNTCNICSEPAYDVVCLPCSHWLCAPCARSLYHFRNPRCPFCNAQVDWPSQLEEDLPPQEPLPEIVYLDGADPADFDSDQEEEPIEPSDEEEEELPLYEPEPTGGVYILGMDEFEDDSDDSDYVDPDDDWMINPAL